VEAALQANIHALHTLNGLGKLRASDVDHALDHEHYGVRMHALRLAERWLDTNDALLAKVVAMTGDADPSVRLQLAMTLGESGNAKAVEALLTLAQQHGSERWMAAAILSSSNDYVGKLLLGLLQQQEASKNARTLLQHLAATVAGRRDVPAMSQALTIITGLDEAIGRACLAGFVDGVSRGNAPIPKSADGWASVSRLLHSESQPVRDLATKLASKLPLADDEQLKIIFANAAKQALNNEGPLDQRSQAIQVLANTPYDTLAPAAIKLLDAKQPPILQHAAITSLGASSDERVGAALLANWPSFTPQIRDAVLKALFARVNRLPALLDAIEKSVVRRGEISAIGREQLTASRDQQIASRAQKLFANPTANADLLERIDRYQRALSGERNVERGKQVFVKNCLACHKLNDEGHDVGPGLGTIINKPDETILLDLLDPSGRIEPEYRSYLVTTEDGRTFTGILVSESPTSVTLRKEKGTSESILRKDIEFIKASNVSLMPSNLHEQTNPQDVADLIGFLRQAFNRPGKK
jgi:putative heme-binding domain-containing protein